MDHAFRRRSNIAQVRGMLIRRGQRLLHCSSSSSWWVSNILRRWQNDSDPLHRKWLLIAIMTTPQSALLKKSWLEIVCLRNTPAAFADRWHVIGAVVLRVLHSSNEYHLLEDVFPRRQTMRISNKLDPSNSLLWRSSCVISAQELFSAHLLLLVPESSSLSNNPTTWYHIVARMH
mmetsp:Transcript_21071/g.60119  ORF Transcript_21071/g.60119 Transcript_21071/m.60119 type:complete len:175 (+) Transcript_21071:98-622(+)